MEFVLFMMHCSYGKTVVVNPICLYAGEMLTPAQQIMSVMPAAFKVSHEAASLSTPALLQL